MSREELDLSGGGLFGDRQRAAGAPALAAVADPPKEPAAAGAGEDGAAAGGRQETGDEASRQSRSNRRSGRRAPSRPDPALFDPTPKKHQLNAKILLGLHKRYMRAIADLRFDEEFDTDLTEVLNAMLFFGPQTGAELRELVEQWREVRSTRGV